jgi:hypothetical protein
VRATVLAVKQTEYVEAAALGESEVPLSLTHVLRNCLAPLIVAIREACPSIAYTSWGIKEAPSACLARNEPSDPRRDWRRRR